jgi:hypothetical protein
MYRAVKACKLFFALIAMAFYLFSPLVPAFIPVAYAQTIQPSTAITATVVSSTTPLTVTFNGRITKGNGTLTFGDGSVSIIVLPTTLASGSVYTFPSRTHKYAKSGTYTVTLTDPDATVHTTVTVSGPSGTPPTCNITVKPTSIQVGGTITLSWTSTNSTGGAITNVGNVGPSGLTQLLPNSNKQTVYVGAFNGTGGTANCQATVTVNTSSGGGSGGGSSGTNGATGGTITEPTVPSTVNTTVPTIKGSGLVPCGFGAFDASGSHEGSTGCQACDIPVLIQNLITFLIGLSIPIAAALFAWAGVLFFTSADNPGRITQAKQIFKNAFVGFLIAITAWLVINTVLSVIFGDGPFKGGKWFTISCASVGRPVSGSINDVFGGISALNGKSPTANGSSGGSGGSGGYDTSGSGGSVSNGGLGGVDSGYSSSGTSGGCPAGYVYLPDADTCSGDDGQFVNPTQSPTSQSLLSNVTSACDSTGDSTICDAANTIADGGKISDHQQDALQDACDGGDSASCKSLTQSIAIDSVSGSNTDCSASNLQAAAATGGYNLTDAQAATLSCIAVPESACGRDNRIATTPSGQVTSAAGMFQIVFGSGNDQCHNLNLDVCTQAAQAAGYQVDGSLNCYATVVKQGQRTGSPACRAAAANINCNASAAACLVQANKGSFRDWTADSRSSAQAKCIQNNS